MHQTPVYTPPNDIAAIHASRCKQLTPQYNANKCNLNSFANKTSETENNIQQLIEGKKHILIEPS